MTGERLLPDEFPLHPTAEYLITGKTRPRRFVPPGSQHLKQYKPLARIIHQSQKLTEEGALGSRMILNSRLTRASSS
jgi:hypothetical protein